MEVAMSFVVLPDHQTVPSSDNLVVQMRSGPLLPFSIQNFPPLLDRGIQLVDTVQSQLGSNFCRIYFPIGRYFRENILIRQLAVRVTSGVNVPVRFSAEI